MAQQCCAPRSDLRDLAGQGCLSRTLVANYGDFGGRDFQANQAMVRVEVQEHFEIGSGYAQAIVGLASGA